MAQFIDSQAKDDDKSGTETNEEGEEGEEEATESDIAFIASENTPEKSCEMSELEKMDAKLNKKKNKPKAKRKLESSDEEQNELVIVEKPNEKKDEEEENCTPPPKPKKKKQKPNSIPPPPESDEEEEEPQVIKTRIEMKCPICPNFLNSGYTKKDGRYFMFCKGESCCMSWFDEGSVGSYIVQAKLRVLKKYKHPNPVVRCHCDVGTRLTWLRFNENQYLNDRLFFICKVTKKEGGKCGYVMSADEMNATNARNLVAHFDSSEKKAAKKNQENTERLMYNVREAERNYAAKKAKKGAKK